MNIKQYVVDRGYKASQGIAASVLVCLGIGLLLQTMGQLLDWEWLTKLGNVAKTLFIPSLGMGMAIAFGTTSMVVICATIVATIGGGGIVVLTNGTLGITGGEPVGAILSTRL